MALLPRLGGVADCSINALAESVIATLGCELSDQQPSGRFNSLHQAKFAVFN
jgi:hypothetical protein